jgi:hypothetical protein
LLPRTNFQVNKKLNRFCHLSVLYAECMPAVVAAGVLSNTNDRNRHASLKRKEIQEPLQRIGLRKPLVFPCKGSDKRNLLP